MAAAVAWTLRLLVCKVPAWPLQVCHTSASDEQGRHLSRLKKQIEPREMQIANMKDQIKVGPLVAD